MNKIRIIGFLVAVLMALVPLGTVGAATTANVTVNATPAFISISVSPTTYSFGVVQTSTNASTTTGYFTITNGSTIVTNQTIGVANSTWLGGTAWAHSNTGTPNTDQVGMYASKNTGTFDTIVKLYTNSPNKIASAQAAGSPYNFELRIMTPTSFSDGVIKSNVVVITASA